MQNNVSMIPWFIRMLYAQQANMQWWFSLNFQHELNMNPHLECQRWWFVRRMQIVCWSTRPQGRMSRLSTLDQTLPEEMIPRSPPWQSMCLECFLQLWTGVVPHSVKWCLRTQGVGCSRNCKRGIRQLPEPSIIHWSAPSQDFDLNDDSTSWRCLSYT